jgi:hypothetical protein
MQQFHCKDNIYQDIRLVCIERHYTCKILVYVRGHTVSMQPRDSLSTGQHARYVLATKNWFMLAPNCGFIDYILQRE